MTRPDPGFLRSNWLVGMLITATSMACAVGLQIWLLQRSLATEAASEPDRITNPGHIDAAYAGRVYYDTERAGATTSFDPNLNAGDAGSVNPAGVGRLVGLHARLFMDGMSPEHYRAIVFLVAASIPCFLAFSTLVAGGSNAAVAIAPWIAVAAWGLRPSQELMVSGRCELALFGPLLTGFVCSFYGYHRSPGLITWLGLVGTHFLGWALIPMPWTALTAAGTICWLLVAHRHDLVWNGLAVLAFIVGLAWELPPFLETFVRPDNLPQLTPSAMTDWLTPSARAALPLDGAAFYPVGVALVFGILRRCVIRAQRYSAAEWIFGCSLGGLSVGFVLHYNGFISPATMDLVGLWTTYLLVPAVAFWIAWPWRPAAWLTAIAVATGVTYSAIDISIRPESWSIPWGNKKLETGWTVSEAAWREELWANLNANARMLWERQPHDRFTPTMLPLDLRIPILTGRDLESNDQPWSFTAGSLANRPIGDWTEDDLIRYCDRWNVGWIRAANSATQQRMRRWKLAKSLPNQNNQDAPIFAIDRPHSYFLRGQGKVESSLPNHIVLTDVVPERGEVVLSFCWHPGWRAAPSHVVIEPESNAFDSAPLMRLKMETPISRLVLYWNGP